MFCESSLGWPGVYYFHAAVTIFLFSLFFLVYRDNPEKHPFVGTIERRKISAGKDPEEIKQRKNIPIWEILKSPPVWAVFVASLGNFAGINLILQFSPTYLNKVMGYTVASTGFLAALPPFLEAIMKEISGITNDKIRFVRETPKTKIYNTIAFFSLATCLIILSFVPPGYPTLALILLTAGNCFLGFTTGGFYKSGSLIARQYAPFVLGQTSTGMTIMILVIPLLVNAITVDNSPVQWAWCFRIVAGFMILADIFYVLFASGEPCEWALCTDRVRPSIRPTGLYVPSKEPSEASGSRHPSEEIAVP
ncbi:Protein T27D12.1 a [Aphelenchoides avenae]|nr:Protein T27D12.1 a [Aphelenchus avenae]